MAIATSIIHDGLRGAFGKFIFRNYNGKTVVSVRPTYKNETNTAARKQARGRFRDATAFARKAMTDTKLKAYYSQKARQLKVPNAYTAAITDYLRKAKVSAIGRSSFSASKGDVIQVSVNKGVFRVNKGTIKLLNSQGQIISEQTLEATNSIFTLQLSDNFPDFVSIKIKLDEPDPRDYIIQLSDMTQTSQVHRP